MRGLGDRVSNEPGLNRRDFLKRGAALGGTLVWATPIVQVIGMHPALAQTVSPVCANHFAVKIELDEGSGALFCVDIYDQTDPDGQGQCLDVDATANPIAGGCSSITGLTKVNGKKWVIGLDSDCAFQFGEAFIKTGSKEGFCMGGGVYDPVNSTVTFETGSEDISNVQFVFCKMV